MRGFVLAAGFGTRLRPITDHVPKALVPVCGRPALERALEFMRGGGVGEIAVNAHYLAGSLRDFQKTSAIPFTLFDEKEKIRGTGGAFDNAREFLEGDDCFFVCNVDIVYALDLAALAREFCAGKLACSLLAVPAVLGAGTIYYRPENGRFAGVPSDGPPEPGARGADFIGAAFYRRGFLDCVTRETFSIVPVWKEAQKRGLGVGVRLLDTCYWRDMGSPASMARLHFDVLDGAPALDIPPHLVLDRARKRCYPARLEGALLETIGPYAWVETTAIHPGCRISESVVLEGAVLPREGKVWRSILTPFGEVPIGS